METTERFQGCLLGLAIGDAVGTSLEFKRGLSRSRPLGISPRLGFSWGNPDGGQPRR